jgi:copper chaperone CopZ
MRAYIENPFRADEEEASSDGLFAFDMDQHLGLGFGHTGNSQHLREHTAFMPTSAPLQLLDDPHEWTAFSRLLDGAAGLWESQVLVGGMHCAACSVTIEDALCHVPGVQSATVSASGQRATVRWRAGAVLPSQWMQAVLSSGYQVLPANDAVAVNERRVESRAALWRWLVAALAGSVASGALVMALFAVGTGVSMVAGPWLWLLLRDKPVMNPDGGLGVLVAGAALAASAGWALWMGLARNAAPWCTS